MKFCKDCKFFRKKWLQHGTFGKCYHPSSLDPYSRIGDILTGYGNHQSHAEYRHASVMRESQVKGSCGKDAAHFEAK